MDVEYLCRAPEPGEQVGWWVRDPAGAVVDWGPPMDLEMAADIGGMEQKEAGDGRD